MNIMPVNEPGPYRTGTLEGFTAGEIEAALGFAANIDDDPDKVKYSWGFMVDGRFAAIWDYYNSHKLGVWSTYDPNNVLPLIFKKETK